MPSLDISTLVNIGLPVLVSAAVALLVTRQQLKSNSKMEDRKLRNVREREHREQQLRLASLYSERRDAEDEMWHFMTTDLYGLVHAGKIPSEETIRQVQREAENKFRRITSVSGRLQLLDPCDERVEQVWQGTRALDIALCCVRGLKPENEWGGRDSYEYFANIKRLGVEWTKKRNELLPRLRKDFAPAMSSGTPSPSSPSQGEVA